MQFAAHVLHVVLSVHMRVQIVTTVYSEVRSRSFLRTLHSPATTVVHVQLAHRARVSGGPSSSDGPDLWLPHRHFYRPGYHRVPMFIVEARWLVALIAWQAERCRSAVSHERVELGRRSLELEEAV